MEGDGWEGIVVDSPGLQRGADVVGLPVLERLVEEQGGGRQGHQHQHSPDEPGAGGLAPGDVVKPVDCRGGEKVVKFFQPHGSEVSERVEWVLGCLIPSYREESDITIDTSITCNINKEEGIFYIYLYDYFFFSLYLTQYNP